MTWWLPLPWWPRALLNNCKPFTVFHPKSRAGSTNPSQHLCNHRSLLQASVCTLLIKLKNFFLHLPDWTQTSALDDICENQFKPLLQFLALLKWISIITGTGRIIQSAHAQILIMRVELNFNNYGKEIFNIQNGRGLFINYCIIFNQ